MSDSITCITHVADCDDCGGFFYCEICGELHGWCRQSEEAEWACRTCASWCSDEDDEAAE